MLTMEESGPEPGPDAMGQPQLDAEGMFNLTIYLNLLCDPYLSLKKYSCFIFQNKQYMYRDPSSPKNHSQDLLKDNGSYNPWRIML